MRKTLLISVAAIALTAASFASAQPQPETRGPAAAPAAPSANQPTTAPAPSSAPAEIQATTPDNDKNAHPGKPGATKGARENTPPTQRSTQQQQPKGTGTPQSTENGPAATPNSEPNARGTADRDRSGTDRDRSASDRDRPMTSRSVSLTSEQKTTIRTRVLTSNAPRVTGRVNFDIRVGVVVPRTVRVAPVPVEIVEIEPEWRGYMYFVSGDEIIVVEPSTLRIVAVLDV